MTSKRARPGPGPQVAGSEPGGPGFPVPEAEVKSATFGYLGAIFSGPLIPLVTYAIGRKRSPFRRFHAAMALNLSLTGVLYALCCLILCGLLLLDSLTAALVVVIPIAFGLWLSVLRYLIRGIGAANRGERYDVPGWICAQIAKPLTR